MLIHLNIVRKLQTSLADFRRLCIFKGIYPRQPGNRKKAAKNSTPSTTFYYTKDIQYLLHEPLLAKFRDHNALAKKIARRLSKAEYEDAARIEKQLAPRMTLDHIIKERYPTFLDALRDLDDALSMLFLFANLPSHTNVPPKTIRLCQRLCHEFQHYLIVTHSLRKSFLSIKGIYYQASIQGQDVLWLVPYNFVQRVTGDVDFRIMGTFVEFYTTLLGFVNYRLYTTVGFVYPPKFNVDSDENGAGLTAFLPQTRAIKTSQGTKSEDGIRSHRINKAATKRAQAIANSISQSEQVKVDDDRGVESGNDDSDDAAPELPSSTAEFQIPSESNDEIQLPSLSSSEKSQKAAGLFKPFVIFLSRETPRAPLEFLLKAFGCNRIGWNEVLGSGAFTHDERDERITHQVIDRPQGVVSNDSTEKSSGSQAFNNRIPGRTYVQPQWVWDSVNACELLSPDLYAPGATLPPHLSPFVKPKTGEYDPTQPVDVVSDEEDQEINQRDVQEGPSTDRADGDVEGGEKARKDKDTIDGVENVKDKADLNGMDSHGQGEGLGSEADNLNTTQREPANPLGDFAGFSDDDANSEQDEYERELKAEATGKPPIASQSDTNLQKQAEKVRKQRKREKEVEEKERQKMMLSRKKRTLYDKMEFGNAQRNAEADKLRAKRRKIERTRG